MSEKRKRLPSFQHYPANRAKKLKQTWVQNQKIKSKWKMEKRKAGLAVPRPEEDLAVNDPESDVEDEESEPSVPTQPPPTKRARELGKEDVSDEPAPTRPPPPKKRVREHSKPAIPEAESSAAPSLRDRAREAYSQASLHTYRSDPFGKRPRGGKVGTRGRGQPNMKLRMGVLLETIKRDFT
ncbi:hypothetical protein MSAN_00987500 [Mycena sanguinolenta]|uniref:rRNA-processing protein FYV7 n=1 Tax=Mycena sanguinolenta TaxID=230812 RepID=A0A8H6YS30_9AGAR|nr:hypothetical protein MSAN_00987500 [Mycena sanguinolenta]